MIDPDYHLFASVVEGGSLSAAARALHISPAMASKRLARLEARLGVMLIHRTTRRLALTQAGERFHGDVVAILRAVREAEARVTGDRDEPQGALRVSAPTSFGRLHVVPLLHAFLVRHPRVALEIDLTDAYVDLLGGRVDVAIRIAADVPANLVAHRIGSNRRVLCASPVYLAAHGMPDTIAALQQHRLLAADGQLPWQLTDGRRARSVDGRSHVRTNSSEVVRELAITGVGIALRSLWDVGDALADGRLVRVLPDWEGPSDLAIHAVHPYRPNPPPAVAAFIAFLGEALGDAS
ncbi:LysR family transcriptional regulator [Sphingomonas donggukensis]|uniref:LysR family transcriptional regulator n=1 Tax=Sphingomonas donggukensis TaxID=2949093 RepID=A0ABY4TWB3_9SPHN|nr:LysR family transcriptional regulator [Sphingomonas donggukensis]URW76688.1 LysR family transcriptional regulator [Sphingomonas donggukensis]